ncbi:hypothetical protein Tco_0292056 [Tanacetum coccineum]
MTPHRSHQYHLITLTTFVPLHLRTITPPSPSSLPPRGCHSRRTTTTPPLLSFFLFGFVNVYKGCLFAAENTTKVVFGWVDITTAAPQGVGLVANLSSFLDLGYPTEKHAQIGVFVSAFYCQTGVFGLLAPSGGVTIVAYDKNFSCQLPEELVYTTSLSMVCEVFCKREKICC